MSFNDKAIKNLDNYANLMEFVGENRFKINAFRGAANLVRKIDSNLEESIRDNSISKIKGIGKGIQSFLTELLNTGTVKEYDDLKGSIPSGILDILKIRGLGVKKVKMLYDELNIKTIDELERLCVTHQVSKLKGFTEHTEQSLLAEIENIEKYSKYMLFNNAEYETLKIVEKLSKINSIVNLKVSGELRRGCEIIAKIIIVISVNDIENFKESLLILYEYKQIEASISSEILNLITNLPIEVELHICHDELFPLVLFNTTGSLPFRVILKFDESKYYDNEFAIFEQNNLQYVIPEMREEEYFNAPSKLKENSNLEYSNMVGLLHFHTNYSDGLNSIYEMALEAQRIGFKYMAICDHSRSAFYANGLDEGRLNMQREEIDNIKDKLDIEIFHGIESDILKDGSLDYTDDTLKNLDFIVASVHSNFTLSEEEMTARMIKAIENEYTDVLGHPTGRLLLSRLPYRVNIKKILEACVKNDVTVEINASPHRLDLDWRNIYFARELGCNFTINPDAHSTNSIREIEYGIKIARKGGLQSSEVINYLSLEDFKKYLKRKVNRKF